MSDTVLVAGITALATVVCQLIISGRSAALIAYRVELLEKKVDDLNSLILCLHDVKSTGKSSHSENKMTDSILPKLHSLSLFSSDNPIA